MEQRKRLMLFLMVVSVLLVAAGAAFAAVPQASMGLGICRYSAVQATHALTIEKKDDVPVFAQKSEAGEKILVMHKQSLISMTATAAHFISNGQTVVATTFEPTSMDSVMYNKKTSADTVAKTGFIDNVTSGLNAATIATMKNDALLATTGTYYDDSGGIISSATLEAPELYTLATTTVRTNDIIGQKTQDGKLLIAMAPNEAKNAPRINVATVGTGSGGLISTKNVLCAALQVNKTEMAIVATTGSWGGGYDTVRNASFYKPTTKEANC